MSTRAAVTGPTELVEHHSDRQQSMPSFSVPKYWLNEIRGIESERVQLLRKAYSGIKNDF